MITLPNILLVFAIILFVLLLVTDAVKQKAINLLIVAFIILMLLGTAGHIPVH